MSLILEVASEVLSLASKGIRLGALGFGGAGAILDFNGVQIVDKRCDATCCALMEIRH